MKKGVPRILRGVHEDGELACCCTGKKCKEPIESCHQYVLAGSERAKVVRKIKRMKCADTYSPYRAGYHDAIMDVLEELKEVENG